MAGRRCLTAGLVLHVALIGPAALAQDIRSDRLTSADTLRCLFPLVAAGTWKDGAPHADVRPAALRITFTSINVDEGSATTSGQFGRSEIVAKLSANALHFIQSFRDGPVYMTTVFDGGRGGGKLRAVHTRHEYSDVSVPGFTSSPEQYYGECEAERQPGP